MATLLQFPIIPVLSAALLNLWVC